jgi:putative membrane-bound dehydrogenase-like protein
MKAIQLRLSILLLLALSSPEIRSAPSQIGNRLTYLDSSDPFYVHRDFPKLTTPQWIGEPGVQAVVVLAIDDMRETKKYETVLRPTLERLKKIDGRAPVSIMTNTNDVSNPQLQSWLKEGLSIEVHTMTHPCPCLAGGNFTSAANNYNDCIDLLSQIPGNAPVAFRMPCCDSMNSPSPRFYSEIFPQVTKDDKFLSIDSSVMLLLTPEDPALPRELVTDKDGKPRFRKYFPTQTNKVTRLALGGFATYIENYPYPYVIDRVCWEFPCIVPSDWEAQNVLGPNSDQMLADWEAALDATVVKQGVMTMIFHPHGWSKTEQFLELIDYAQKKHGSKVKFLNFREALDRLNKNLLVGKSLRNSRGLDSGTRLLDIDNDGYLDVLLGDSARLWRPKAQKWEEVRGVGTTAATVFGVQSQDGRAAVLQKKADNPAAPLTLNSISFTGLELGGAPISLFVEGVDQGVRLRDVDGDGISELIVSNPKQNGVFKWDATARSWKLLPFALPKDTMIVDGQGHDAGLRFVDVNGDGYDDVLFSNRERYSLHLFVPKPNELGWKVGWNDEVVSSLRSGSGGIPMISRGGERPDNGVWFKNQTMWIQNEDTANLPDRVDRRTFKQLLDAGSPKPLAPRDALKGMRVRPGFTVELVASEPLVQDPIAFEWGPDGKLWVVEMADYPLGMDGHGQPGGRVKFLEDTDGDGLFDKVTVFLDKVPFPTGVFPWGKGVIVSSAPEIFYAEDTNGDGKADQRKTLFTGFVEGNQQHRLNGFDYGLDDWLYGANGDSGGSVLPANAPSGAQKVNLRQHDFRLKPDAALFEAVAGQTQFGRHRDDWGNWFGNNNPNWLWHYHFPEHYLARNPAVAVKSTKQMLAGYKDGSRCYPASQTLQRFNDFFAYNHVTSGNSPTPYRDELFGPEFRSSVFVSEPVHNLIHREVLEPDGVSFKSHRAPDESTNEFLASTDNWFRPTMLKTGPDGALYIADMYRQVIEHPQWIPKEIQQRLDLRAGHDMGRIYRVYPTGAKPRQIPRLDQMSPDQLINALDSPNGWQRDTAQRLLLHGKEKPCAPALARMLESQRPLTRLQTLWTLDGLEALTPAMLLRGLSDPHAALREHAVRLSEKLVRGLSESNVSHVVQTGETLAQIAGEYGVSIKALQTEGTPPVGEKLKIPLDALNAAAPLTRFQESLLACARDPEIRVRYQLAFSLGEWNDSRAGEALAEILQNDSANETVQNAALSSAVPHAALLAARLENDAALNSSKLLATLKKLAKGNPASTYKETVATVDPAARKQREAVIKQYAGVSELKGNPAHGLQLYQQNCSTCHRLQNQGNELGPDLATVSSKPVEVLLVAILDPNQAVEARYLAYSAATADGREATGLLVAETPTSITLRLAGGMEQVFLKQDLKELKASRMSLMPEGLEKAFSPQDMADLIAAIRKN